MRVSSIMKALNNILIFVINQKDHSDAVKRRWTKKNSSDILEIFWIYLCFISACMTEEDKYEILHR